MANCPKCGVEMDGGEMICPGCGHDVAAAGMPTPPPTLGGVGIPPGEARPRLPAVIGRERARGCLGALLGLVLGVPVGFVVGAVLGLVHLALYKARGGEAAGTEYVLIGIWAVAGAPLGAVAGAVIGGGWWKSK
jgi:hypothetical protein